jgi:hypothetical protein
MLSEEMGIYSEFFRRNRYLFGKNPYLFGRKGYLFGRNPHLFRSYNRFYFSLFFIYRTLNGKEKRLLSQAADVTIITFLFVDLRGTNVRRFRASSSLSCVESR